MYNQHQSIQRIPFYQGLDSTFTFEETIIGSEVTNVVKTTKGYYSKAKLVMALSYFVAIDIIVGFGFLLLFGIEMRYKSKMLWRDEDDLGESNWKIGEYRLILYAILAFLVGVVIVRVQIYLAKRVLKQMMEFIKKENQEKWIPQGYAWAIDGDRCGIKLEPYPPVQLPLLVNHQNPNSYLLLPGPVQNE
eukprot:TRINITY_DN22297_c0_g1_i1.p1 TRINITY_DN22297_c0_g1~~TRINITY_DN22297_c0_g1_i1.p1  ORF type:complete len:190 (+),score=20.54 TRINITY_DN22297_c0_g1_i1:9-578(+)